MTFGYQQQLINNLFTVVLHLLKIMQNYEKANLILF